MGIQRLELFEETEAIQSKTFGLLASAARIRIIKCLLTREQMALHELTLELQLSQSTVSAHVKKMKDVGLVDSLESGTAVYYSLNFIQWDQIKWTLQLYIEEMNELWR